MKEATKHEASLIRDGVMDDDTCLVVSAADYDALRQQLADVSNERDGLRVALSGMLFEFDDGVGEEWSSDLLDYARTLCDAVEFKPSAEVKS